MPNYGVVLGVSEQSALDEIGVFSGIAGKYRAISPVASSIVDNFLDAWREAASVFREVKEAVDARDFATYNAKSERLRQIHESCLFLFTRLLKVIPNEKAWEAKQAADGKTLGMSGNIYTFGDSEKYGSEANLPVSKEGGDMVVPPSPEPFWRRPDVLKKAGIFLGLAGAALAIVAFLRRR
jgi:hypothetical protein